MGASSKAGGGGSGAAAPKPGSRRGAPKVSALAVHDPPCLLATLLAGPSETEQANRCPALGCSFSTSSRADAAGHLCALPAARFECNASARARPTGRFKRTRARGRAPDPASACSSDVGSQEHRGPTRAGGRGLQILTEEESTGWLDSFCEDAAPEGCCFQCPLVNGKAGRCDLRFSQLGQLREHVWGTKRHRSDPKLAAAGTHERHECSMCEEWSWLPSAMERHMKKIHNVSVTADPKASTPKQKAKAAKEAVKEQKGTKRGRQPKDTSPSPAKRSSARLAISASPAKGGAGGGGGGDGSSSPAAKAARASTRKPPPSPAKPPSATKAPPPAKGKAAKGASTVSKVKGAGQKSGGNGAGGGASPLPPRPMPRVPSAGGLAALLSMSSVDSLPPHPSPPPSSGGRGPGGPTPGSGGGGLTAPGGRSPTPSDRAFSPWGGEYCAPQHNLPIATGFSPASSGGLNNGNGGGFGGGLAPMMPFYVAAQQLGALQQMNGSVNGSRWLGDPGGGALGNSVLQYRGGGGGMAGGLGGLGSPQQESVGPGGVAVLQPLTPSSPHPPPTWSPAVPASAATVPSPAPMEETARTAPDRPHERPAGGGGGGGDVVSPPLGKGDSFGDWELSQILELGSLPPESPQVRANGVEAEWPAPPGGRLTAQPGAGAWG